MSKEEFINELRISLTGRMDTASINDNIRYYEDYITKEIRTGKTESEVMDSLGDANAIAISLIDAMERKEASEQSTNNTYSEETSTNKSINKQSFILKAISFFISHPLLTIGLILAAILVLIVLAIFLAVSFFTHFWPIILIVLLAGGVGFLVYHLIKFINKH